MGPRGCRTLRFFLCYQFLLNGRIWEAAPLTIIGIFVFRGGIRLVKVAVAAHVCIEAREALKEKSPPKAAPILPSWQRMPKSTLRRDSQ